MISLKEFMAENGIFIILPLVFAAIKIVHDLLPTAVFLGLGFLCLGVYVAVNHLKENAATVEKTASSEAIMKEFEKDAAKAERKKNRKQQHAERQKAEKQAAIERRIAQERKLKAASKITSADDEREEKSGKGASGGNNNKARRVAAANAKDDDSDDDGEEALLRYASLQKNKK